MTQVRSVSRHGGVICSVLAGVLVLMVSAQRPLSGSDQPVYHASQSTRTSTDSAGRPIQVGLIEPTSGTRDGAWNGPRQASNLPQEISVPEYSPRRGDSLPLPLRRQVDYYGSRRADSQQQPVAGRAMANGIVSSSPRQQAAPWPAENDRAPFPQAADYRDPATHRSDFYRGDSSRGPASSQDLAAYREPPAYRDPVPSPEQRSYRESAPYREPVPTRQVATYRDSAPYRDSASYREPAARPQPDYRDRAWDTEWQQSEMAARSDISTQFPPRHDRDEDAYGANGNRQTVGTSAPDWSANERQEPIRTARNDDRYRQDERYRNAPVPPYVDRMVERNPPPAWPPAGEGVQFDSQPDDLTTVIYGSSGEDCEVCDVCVPVQPYEYQILPEGLIYRSYIAGPKEPRMASNWLNQDGRGMIWEATLGGRVGLIRNGTRGALAPEGWQIDLEGAAQARVDWEDNSDLDAADFRAGLLFTWRRNRFAFKAGYYHVSSHLGDEYMLKNPDFVRRNYVRDSVVAGMFFHMTESLGLYNEVGYAVGAQGGAEPLEYQTGIQYMPLVCVGPKGAPFAGFNAHFRQEFGQDAGFNAVAGWVWVGPRSGHSLRIGAQYYNGPSLQYSFFDQHEKLVGGGIWFDY